MGIKQELKESLEKFEITKIGRQPTDEDMNHFTHELGGMLATAPTTNSGGDHVHICMILDEVEYESFSTCTNPFTVPKNPSTYPTTVRTNEVNHLCQIAEDKHLIIEDKTHQGCLQATHSKIIKAIDPEWLTRLFSELLGFTHQTPIELLTHLHSMVLPLTTLKAKN